MKIFHRLPVLFLALLWAAPCSAVTWFVSGASTYAAGNCGASAGPCVSIGDALRDARPGDIIICLDTPRNEFLTITKSITIDCTSARGALNNTLNLDGSLATGIVINMATGDFYKTVRLRGLTIDGAAGQNRATDLAARYLTHGIEIQSAAVVYVEDCVISNVAQRGIYDHRSGGQTRLYVKNTLISGAGGPGIVAASQGPAVTVLDNLSLLNNAYGLAAATGNNVVITRSTISGNTTAGVHADGGAQINLLNSVLSHNTANMNAYGTVRLQENAIQFSNVAVQGSGARSAGANRFLGNVTLGSTPTLVSGAPADVYD